jgi:hypothetical protein
MEGGSGADYGHALPPDARSVPPQSRPSVVRRPALLDENWPTSRLLPMHLNKPVLGKITNELIEFWCRT